MAGGAAHGPPSPRHRFYQEEAMGTIGKMTAWVVGILIADGIVYLIRRRRK